MKCNINITSDDVKNLIKVCYDNDNNLYISNDTNIYLQDNNIYLNNNEGIYKYDLKKESIEKVLDKAIDTIGDNSLIKNGFLKIDDKKYIVVYTSNYIDEEHNENYIYTYTYSNKVSNKNKKEITLYSLYEDVNIEALIRVYKNNEVKINYEYGISAYGSDISEEEAIKKLNTEMLAKMKLKSSWRILKLNKL